MDIKKLNSLVLIATLAVSGLFFTACESKDDDTILATSALTGNNGAESASDPQTNPSINPDPSTDPHSLTDPSTDPSPEVTPRFYPVILCNGWAGTDYILLGLVEFMHKIKTTLEEAGREVYYAPVPCFSVSSVRSQKIADLMYEVMVQKVVEQAALIDTDGTITEEDKLKVDLSDMKFNLLCHSHGGINARFLSRLLTIPDPRHDDPVTAPKWPAAYFVASITMLSTPNTGTYIAEWIADGAPWPIPQFAQVLGKFYEFLNLDDPQLSDLRGAAREMSESNMKTNMNPMLFKGQNCSHIRVYHMAAYTGDNYYWNIFNINIPFIAVMDSINRRDPTEDRKRNDGVVCTKSAEWSPQLQDYGNAEDAAKGMQWIYKGTIANVDHFQLINQILENLYFGWSNWDARQFYTDHSAFLENNGL